MSNKTTKRKDKKEFSVIGLGRMSGDLALQALEKGWRVVGYYKPHPDSHGQGAAVVLPSLRAQAPPSHYMEYFNMVSKRVAGQDNDANSQCCGPVQVNQCYRCHQTTSWNDIKGVGWYKHH